jgi:predicted enzyme involved in methoxymalonyl-ACP biosynthesis
MSCRVLNRQVEQAILNYVALCARAENVCSLIGQYFKTERNSMVKDHYSKLGFTRLSEDAAGSRWMLDVASYIPVPVPIEIVETIPGRATTTSVHALEIAMEH